MVQDIQTFTKWQDVPIVRFAMVDGGRSDLEIIKEAYARAGAGLGISYRKEK